MRGTERHGESQASMRSLVISRMIKELPKGSVNRNIQDKLLKNLPFMRVNSLHATERQHLLPLEVCKAKLERV